MIDIKTETLLTTSEARNEIPRKPSLPTIWRWMENGVRGVVLESVYLGGRRYTSVEACARFLGQTNKRRQITMEKSDRLASVSNSQQILDDLGVRADEGEP